MSEQTLQDKLREIAESGDCPRAVNEKLITAALQIDELERQLAEAREDQADKVRLDFIMENDAFIVWELFDRTFKRCYLMTQDEDEEYHRLSGDEKSFDTPRQAIDAAMKVKS